MIRFFQMRKAPRGARFFVFAGAALLAAIVMVTQGATMIAGLAFRQASIPDGRILAPEGFTVPVGGFASDAVLSPDGHWLAVVSQDAGAVDVLSTKRSILAERISAPAASGIAWTRDGLYITRGYSGTVARFAYDGTGPTLALTKRVDVQVGTSGLINGVAEDPPTHRLAIARTANQEVVVIDDETGHLLESHLTSGQPYRVGFANGTLVATLYNSDHIDAWRQGSTERVEVQTGPHPTQLLVDGDRFFVANADGHDVVLIGPSLTVIRRFDLSVRHAGAPGQTPAGMALSDDRSELFVAESGFNDVAVVDVTSGRIVTRIPTAWYPTAVSFLAAATVPGKDTRARAQLWIANAKGLGSQPDPGGEWDGTYTGLVQHLIVDPARFAQWTATVDRNNRFDATVALRNRLPPIKHIVFIVEENKHFDEVFGDELQANADPTLLLYGRHFTPNAHALAERYTIFDNFMGNGEASIYGHSWTTQGMANDYHERNAHLAEGSNSDTDRRVASSIWPEPLSGHGASAADMDFDWFADLDDLPKGPRVNVSAVFGPRGELINEFQQKNIPYRVYGEQMTMMPSGKIAPGLAAHAARSYPGDHINFNVLDTERARLFLDDVRKNGLPAYAYMTLPTNHTAGTRPGFYTPASYIANNDFALGTIISGLSKRADWKDTIVFVTFDDPQGTGDHVDAHRMPAFAVGGYARRGFVDHSLYSFPSFLRTVELTFGLPPLNIEDQLAPPMIDAFTQEANTQAYTRLPQQIRMQKNPGSAQAAVSFTLDGPASAGIPEQEWRSIKGDVAYERHLAYLHSIGAVMRLASDVSHTSRRQREGL
jgi:phospholipase C/DNA-binding beta-propeller fold protein YncE